MLNIFTITCAIVQFEEHVPLTLTDIMDTRITVRVRLVDDCLLHFFGLER